MKLRMGCIGVTLWAALSSGLWSPGALAAPHFQVTPSNAATQQVEAVLLPLANVIPAGAHGHDGMVEALGVYLRDPGHAGETRTVRIDYIGSDAAFTDLFSAGGGAVSWCNKLSRCGAGYEALGGGGNDWFGSFTRSATITAVVDELIDFSFVSDVHDEGGLGTKTLHNGDFDDHVHFGVFDLTHGFDFGAFTASGSIVAIGLSNGGYAGQPEPDDDHQDFMVRLSVVPEPSVPALLAAAALGLGAARRRAARRTM